jgi:hypothetical protein
VRPIVFGQVADAVLLVGKCPEQLVGDEALLAVVMDLFVGEKPIHGLRIPQIPVRKVAGSGGLYRAHEPIMLA